MPPKYRIWYDTKRDADLVITNTLLNSRQCERQKIYASDCDSPKKFHAIPDHIKKTLYLDSPDIIVENLQENEPVFNLEISQEAGSGHNPYQRFARLAASVESDCPAFYLFPEAKIISRDQKIKGKKTGRKTYRWDKINPTIFKTLNELMNIHSIPALLYYYPSHFMKYKDSNNLVRFKNSGLRVKARGALRGSPVNDPEMKEMFKMMNLVIKETEKGVIQGRRKLIKHSLIREKRDQMLGEWEAKKTKRQPTVDDWCPLTSVIKIKTKILLKHLEQYCSQGYSIGQMLRKREKTLLYYTGSKFRGDPFPGVLVGIDYLKARNGETFEDREYNLVLVWGKVNISENEVISIKSNNVSISNWIKDVRKSEKHNLLSKDFGQLLKDCQIPRYYMQCRYGSTYSKVKHIRSYSYFADAVLFKDGALWRDG
jgi:hypothetical protein